jgi:hypothetical protein
MRFDPFSFLPVSLPPVTDPTTVFDALRIMVRPVHQTAEFIPLVRAAKRNPIAQA